MKPSVKICGITNLIDAKNSLNLGADFIGFVNIQQSKRYMSIEDISDISREFTEVDKSKLVLLSLENNVDTLVNDLSRLGFKTIQPYGNLSMEDLSKLKLMGFKIFKPIQVSQDQDFNRLNEYRKAVDMILFDSKPSDGSLGGSGETFDWDLFVNAKKHLDIEIGLSGGLNPENINDALEHTRANFVDLSSGLESKPGIKSLNKIKKFFHNIDEYSKVNSN